MVAVEPEGMKPVTPSGDELLQLKVVPVKAEVRITGCVGEPLQTVCVSGLLVTVASGFTVSLTVDTAAGHGPKGSLVVSVTTATPDAMVGVNCEVSEPGWVKVPEGELQVAEEAPPDIEPFSEMVEPAHTLTGDPALATAGG